MGFLNSGLLRAAAQAIQGGVKGDREGKAAARKQQAAEEDRRQRLEEDALRRSMLEFNFGQAQSGAQAQAAAGTREATELAGLRGLDQSFANQSRESIERQLQDRAKPKEAKGPTPGSAEDLRILTAQAAARAAGAPDTRREATSAEQNAAAFSGTQKELAPMIAALENKGIKPSASADFVEGMGNVPVVGGLVRPFTQKGANYLRDEDQQKLRNLARGWMTATLRLDSQGTIRPDEEEGYYQTYFRQPGDSPAMVAQKQTLRAQKEREAEARTGRDQPAGVKGDVPKPKAPSDRARGLVGRIK